LKDGTEILTLAWFSNKIKASFAFQVLINFTFSPTPTGRLRQLNLAIAFTSSTFFFTLRLRLGGALEGSPLFLFLNSFYVFTIRFSKLFPAPPPSLNPMRLLMPLLMRKLQSYALAFALANALLILSLRTYMLILCANYSLRAHLATS